jgi:hypothetical protein
MWRYLPNKDRFEYVAPSTPYGVAYGVTCGWDPVSKKAVMVPNYSTNVRSFTTSNLSWSLLTASNPVLTPSSPVRYTYGDYIDSLGVLALIDKVSIKFWTINPVTAQWDSLPYPVGYVPTDRATLAYDPVNNVVLAVGGGKTFAYTVRTRTWQEMALDSVTPDLGEHIAFDRRHGVFIGSKKGGATYAFRYRAGSGVAVEASLKVPSTLSISTEPNPFVSKVVVAYAVTRDGNMEVNVYDMRGKLFKSLVKGFKPAGNHKVFWNGETSTGKISPAGVYVVRIITSAGTVSRKILLNK